MTYVTDYRTKRPTLKYMSPTVGGNSLVTTPYPPHSGQHHNLKKRTRGDTTEHDVEAGFLEKKKKKKKTGGGGGENTGSVSAVSAVSTVGTVTSPVDSVASELHMDNGSLPQLNTNDDILRAFQSLDFSRLAGVLRTLEIPSAGVDLGTGDNPFTALLDPGGLIDDQIATMDTGNPIGIADDSASAPPGPSCASRGVVGSSSGLKRPPKPCKSNPRTNPNLPAIGPSIANAEHTELLATKWLSAAKLKELVESEGTICLTRFVQPLAHLSCFQDWSIRRGNSHR